MPRLRVITLDQPSATEINVLFWLDVPASRQKFYVNAHAMSKWVDALASDNAALQTGAMVEQERTFSPDQFPSSAAGAESIISAMWTGAQTQIDNYNPWAMYGTTWDGTTWVQATVA